MDCIQLRKRLDAQKTDRTNIEGIWNWIEKFVVPYRGLFFTANTSETENDWRRRQLFDSTAVIANQNLAANIHANVTNPLIRWFNVRFRQSSMNDLHEAKMWVQEVAELIYLALQESNFNLEANELYLDLTSFGTSFMAEEAIEDDIGAFKELAFECLPIYESFFDSDINGEVINYYRLMNWTPLQMVEKFGEEGVTQNIRDKAATAFGGTMREQVVYAIFKRDEFDPATTSTMQVLAPDARPYGYKYFLYASSEMLGEEGGYYEMPIYVPRWRKAAGSMWGHSPAMVCISDVLTLNQLVELILTAAEKVVDPPILTTRRGVFGDVDLRAGGQTTVAALNAIAPFESKARFDVSHLQKQELQNSINKTFFMDQLQLKESPAMTATEVNARVQLMQRLLGPTLGRIQSDWLDPLIERTFKILYRYGQLPRIPDVVTKGGAELEIEYLGTMARAQRYDEVAATERWLGNITAMSEKFQDVTDVVNSDQAARDMGLSMGVPAKYMNSRDQVKVTRNSRKQVEQVAMAEQAGNAMKSVGEGVKALTNDTETAGTA